MGLAVEMVLAEKRGEVEGFSLLGLSKRKIKQKRRD